MQRRREAVRQAGMHLSWRAMLPCRDWTQEEFWRYHLTLGSYTGMPNGEAQPPAFGYSWFMLASMVVKAAPARYHLEAFLLLDSPQLPAAISDASDSGSNACKLLWPPEVGSAPHIACNTPAAAASPVRFQQHGKRNRLVACTQDCKRRSALAFCPMSPVASGNDGRPART